MKTAGYFKQRHLWSSRNICVRIRNTLVLHLNRIKQMFLCALKNILVERVVYIKILKHTCGFLRVHLFILRPFRSKTRPCSSGEHILCLTRSTIPVNFSTFLKLAARSSATSMTTSRPCCRVWHIWIKGAAPAALKTGRVRWIILQTRHFSFLSHHLAAMWPSESEMKTEERCRQMCPRLLTEDVRVIKLFTVSKNVETMRRPRGRSGQPATYNSVPVEE